MTARPLALPHEFQLVAACAMWPPSDRRTEAIRTAALGSIDWDRLVRVAKRHQVVGLVHEGLTRARVDLPFQLARAIGAQASTLTHENLATAREALRLQRLFNEENLPALFIKGAALAVLAFSNIGLRSSEDIDLMIPYERLPAATAIIMAAGYRRFDPPPDISDATLQLLMPLRKDLGFVHEVTRQRIELHWRLFLNPYAMAKTSSSTSRLVPIAGKEGLYTLDESDLFAYLCMHGALHSWNRIKWIADVNALIASAPTDVVERLINAAAALGAGPAADQAVLLCRSLFQTPLPASVTARLDKGATLYWLEKTALNAMTAGHGEVDPHEVRFGTTRGTISNFLLNRSWRYWLAELSLLMTNQTDVLTIPLPKQLKFLYPILRFPLWIWRHAFYRSTKSLVQI